MKQIASILLFAALACVGHSQNNSLTLDRALSLARANRSSVSAAELRVESARQSRRALSAYPATRLFVGYSSDPATGATDDDLALIQPLDLFGRASAARSLGDAAVARAEAELSQALADIQAEVIKNYSEAAAAHAFAESALLSERIAQDLYGAIKILVDEGRVPGVHLSRVGIEVDRARLAARQRKTELAANLQRLSGLIGIPVDQVTISDFANVPSEMLDPNLLAKQRADLQILAAEVAAAQAEAGVARLGALPELELQSRRTEWQEADARYGLRIQLAVPIFDFGKSRAETAAARALAKSASRALADATRIAESELAAARIELISATQQIDGYKAVVESAKSLVEKARLGFAERAVTLIEFLEATSALREVDEAYIEARLRLATAQAGYLRASGRILEVGR